MNLSAAWDDQLLNGESMAVADNSSGMVKGFMNSNSTRNIFCVCLILYELAKWMSRIFVINVAYATAYWTLMLYLQTDEKERKLI
jgi:hypothetical protein